MKPLPPDPLTIVGPFATIDEAKAHAEEHKTKNPNVAAMADVLLSPENCPDVVTFTLSDPKYLSLPPRVLTMIPP